MMEPKYYDTVELSSYRLWQIVEQIEERQAEGYRLLSLVQLGGDSGYFAVMEREEAEEGKESDITSLDITPQREQSISSTICDTCGEDAVGSDVSEKLCPKCGETKPATAEYFHRGSSRRDGLAYACKVCLNAYKHIRYVANKEKLTELRRIRYAIRKATRDIALAAYKP